MRRAIRELWRSARVSASTARARSPWIEASVPRSVPSSQTRAPADRFDEWASLQDLRGPDAQRLLEEEEKDAKAFFADAASFERQLQDEASRILLPEAEAPPEAHGSYNYFQRYDANGFVIFCRAPRAGGEIEVLLDTGALAEEAGTGFADVTHCKISDDHAVLAYTVDLVGDESYELRFVTLKPRRSNWIVRLPGVRSFEFLGVGNSATGIGILAVHADPQTQRSCRISYWLISPSGIVGDGERVLWNEEDEAAYLEVFRTKDRKFVLLSSNTKDTSEVRVVRCGVEDISPHVMLSRQDGVEYFAEHRDGFFYVISNHERSDFAIYRLAVEALKLEYSGWSLLTPFFRPPGGLHVTDADAFAGWLVIYGHEAAGPRICVVPLDLPDITEDAQQTWPANVASQSYLVSLPSPVGSVEPSTNPEPESTSVQFTFRSPLEPGALYDLNLLTKDVSLVRRRLWNPNAGVSPEQFVCERVEYPTRDGEYVPLTLMRSQHSNAVGAQPCLLHIYGAYGTCLTPDFRVENIALLRRGWAIAWAHIRGGGEKGRQWHIDARQLNKARSVYDLADAVKFIIARGVAAPSGLCIKAASAGGLTLGAFLNSSASASLISAAVLEVPFVDAFTGMLDSTLPLTVHEFAEWGDPRHSKHAANLCSLSPYENIGSHQYPPLYMSCALADARVPPWMALKYAARLRARLNGYLDASTSSGLRRRGRMQDRVSVAMNPQIVLHCAQGGHGGAMDWHGRTEEFARQIIFLHKALGLPLT